MSTSTIFTTDGPIPSLTFKRPEARNALTWEMYDALVAACERVAANPHLRVFIVKGAGGAFAAGTDIAQFTSLSTRDDAIAYERRLDAVIDRLERVAVATIAQVEGVAAGGGLAIALACDLRVCSADARFGVPIARTTGNTLSPANLARMLDLVGPGAVKDLLFTGRFMNAAEAHAIGLATRVVDTAVPGGVESVVQELADAIAANAPLTIRAVKESV